MTAEADYGRRLGALSAEQRALLELRSRKRGLALPGDLPPITRRPPGSDCLLSIDQERLWFIDRLRPGITAYNIHLSCLLRGPLDAAAMELAFQEVVKRHEPLRTTIAEVDGRPRAVLHDPPPFVLQIEDLSGLPSPTREEERQVRLSCIANQPFDLEKGPLLRAALLRTDPQEHALIVAIHHIATDKVSMSVLERELTALYGAFRLGKPSPLPDLPIQYGDFAAWQRKHLTGTTLERLSEYWARQLESAPLVLNLPTDQPRSAGEGFSGVRHPFALNAALGSGLRALARREGVTPFMLYMAAFGALLQRYSGQDEILIGTPIANRSRPEVRDLIGYLLNVLPVRVDLRGNPTFRELLARVRGASLGLYGHRDLPFGSLVELLNVPRDLSRNPIFQVSLVYLETGAAELELAGLSVAPLVPKVVGSRFEITMAVLDSDHRTTGFLEYRTDLWSEATMDRMVGHLRNLLEGVLRDPGRAVGALPILDEGEKRQILEVWSETRREHRDDGSLHGLIEVQVERHPDRVAVSFEGRSLTYRELDGRSGRLARRLRALGVGPEVVVAIALERSLDLPVAVLATLKAGGAYLPLDPTFPIDRLAFMVDDARAQVVLTQAALRDSLPFPRSEVLCMDEPDPEHESGPLAGPSSLGGGEHVAYVIYTSGSTGRPKGVQVPHRAVVNVLRALAERPGLEAHDVLLTANSSAFDMATLDLLLPLTQGARLEVVGRAVAGDGRLLVNQVVSSQATVMHATPSTWRMMLEAGWPGGSFEVWSGGEPLTAGLAEALLRRKCTVWNLYGPTECAIVSAVHPVGSPEPLIPIGRPVPNAALYVLGPALEPVPAGVPGELYVGGEGLARGYVGRSDLTAERFVPDPFGPHPGGRLYRTGDLVRWRLDGSLEFLGRKDDQVKVRGFRIELGEIETVLASHPAVSEVAVVVREDRPGDRQIVAYVVWKTGPAPDLVDWARRSLPNYMLPRAVVSLDRLPLTSNRKVDRHSLPPPRARSSRAVANPHATATGDQEVNPIQMLLVEIWKEVLAVDEVLLEDNFFDLGGHSLHVTQVVSRIRGIFGVDLPIATAFDTSTVSEQARAVMEQLVARHGQHEVARMLALASERDPDATRP